LTKSHALHCLNMHGCSIMPETMTGPLSFLLNLLLTRYPYHSVLPWTLCWPILSTVLFELD
ncbi:hypothetical protein EDC96DRAFT_447814, partial [Choanephora cucurbitarum]